MLMDVFFATLFYMAAAVQCLMFVTALLNARSIRQDRAVGTAAAASGDVAQAPSVSVLVPARNEAQNLPRLIASFERQNYTEVEFLIYDDLSTDNTWDIISTATDVRIRGVRGTELPDGWVGKVHACHRLAEEAKGDVLIFLDADTEFLHPGALQQLITSHSRRRQHTVLTAMPALRGGGQLLISVVGHFILALAPWWLHSKIPSPLLAGLNGQCWLIEAVLYHRHLPHLAVKNEVLEDVMIGRYLHGLGITPVLTDWQDDLAVYMYSSLWDAWRGFRKNASSMLGPTTGISLLTWAAFALMFVVAPLINPVLYVGQIVVKLVTDRVMRQPLWLSLRLSLWRPLWISMTVPLSFILMSLVGLDSIVARARGQLRWKGRSITL